MTSQVLPGQYALPAVADAPAETRHELAAEVLGRMLLRTRGYAVVIRGRVRPVGAARSRRLVVAGVVRGRRARPGGGRR